MPSADHGFLDQAKKEDGQPDHQILAGAGLPRPGQLRLDLAKAQDRAGDDARKKRDEQRVFQQIRSPALAAPNIGQKADLLECKKRNAERQDNRPDQGMGAEQQIEIAAEEPGIFEDADRRQIGGHPRSQEPVA